MKLQQNRLLFSGSLVDVYALQAFLQEQEIKSAVYDPSASAAASGFASGSFGVIELYVNELDFTMASEQLDVFTKGLKQS